MINVTKAYLPDKAEFYKYIDEIWERGHLTNHGPLVLELEEKLKNYLGVKYFFFTNNGTIALQIAIKALDLAGEIITTPFSYIATTSSILWEGCKPVFADIDSERLTLDPSRIEPLINENTVAILATHVYGIPCAVDEIEQLAANYRLKVIYDAAHAFGITYKNRGVMNYGDISTVSFHATKLFHTIEGGGLCTNDPDLAHRISYMRNFGHNGPEAFFGVGVNGKASEFNAAMGLSILPHIDQIIEERRKISAQYDSIFSGIHAISRPQVPTGTSYNYAYYPVLFSSEAILLKVREQLNFNGVFPRRYFYPSLNKLEYLSPCDSCAVSEYFSSRVLCLPLYTGLDSADVERIGNMIKEAVC